jgi:hypothetical protein
MKKTKTEKNTARKPKRYTKTTGSVKLAHTKTKGLRHLRLVEVKHTGKLIHHRHTSHLALIILLAIVGFFLYISQELAWATQEASSGSVSVGVIVPGPAPTVGAVITEPVDGAVLSDIDTLQVGGTCTNNSFVVVYNNQSLVGSTSCSSAGVFRLTVQPIEGQNALSALNFDNLNQPGPKTATVTINVKRTVPTIEVPTPDLPDNPSIITGVISEISGCDDYNPQSSLPTGGQPHVMVVCVPRIFDLALTQKMGVLVWGGEPPYAVRLLWDAAKSDTLLSMEAPGYKTIKFKYSSAGVYNVNVRVVDKKYQTGTTSTSVQVNGQAASPTLTQLLSKTFNNSWFYTPVPLYVMSVALTLGFWGGDIFDRRFGARRPRQSHRALR